MKKEMKRIPDFDDIIFEIRNKEYGAYSLRKKYDRTVMISILNGILIMAVTVIAPYFNAMALEGRQNRAERQVELRMENLDQPDAAPVLPPPPPPPSQEVVQQVKYVPPVVVDSVKSDEAMRLMTADEAQIEVQNVEVVDVIQETREEVREMDVEPEPFIVVEEMPEPHGGAAGLNRYLSENVRYPQAAQENNIQGRVFVRFCVTARGSIEQVSILRSVDPALDAEAIRVVKTLPAFKPGRQGGKPVPVWFSVQINFQLKDSE